MLNITNVLFRPHTLLIIRKENGQIQQGTVVDVDDDGIRVRLESGTLVTLTLDELSRIESCYIGVPTIEEKNVPLKIRPNGKVLQFSGGSGMIKTEDGLCTIQNKSLAS